MAERILTSSCLYGWENTEQGHKKKEYIRHLTRFDNRSQKYIDNIKILSEMLGIYYQDLIGSGLEIKIEITRLKDRVYYKDGTVARKIDLGETQGFRCNGEKCSRKLCKACQQYLDEGSKIKE